MSLTQDDFNNGQRLFRGKLNEEFPFDGKTIFKTSSGEFFVRTDYHILPITGFFPDIEIYRINGNLVLVFLASRTYTFIQSIKVIESNTIKPFDGFLPNKVFSLKNGQVWQQIDGPNSPCSSSGSVKIVNDKQIKVDSWDFYPKIKLIDGKRI
jgi:hypothetical protein